MKDTKSDCRFWDYTQHACLNWLWRKFFNLLGGRNMDIELATLHHRLDLLVCQDNDDECWGCKNSDECLELIQAIEELEKSTA